MKLTLIAIGSLGDVRPFITLGRELTRRGHRVTIAAFSDFAETVRKENLLFFPLIGDSNAFMGGIFRPDTNAIRYLPRLRNVLDEIAPKLIADLTTSCQEADALICNYFGSVYYSVAELLGIPCIQTYFFIMDPNGDMPISAVRFQRGGKWLNLLSYRLGYYLIGLLEKRLLGSWRRDCHLSLRPPSTGPDYRIGRHTVPAIYAMSPHLIPRPKEWPSSVHMSGFWQDEKTCDWKPSKALERFVVSGSDLPIYVGFGSMVGEQADRLMDLMLSALTKTGLRAVILMGKRSCASRPSDDRFFFTDFVPHEWLFPKVRAVVHHGGAGTTAAGLRFGLPTLIIPFAGDQLFWGYHVWKAVCGPRPVPCKAASERKLIAALQALTVKAAYRENAAHMGEMLSVEQGTRNAADLIEKEISVWMDS